MYTNVFITNDKSIAILHKTPFIPFWFRKWEVWSLTGVKGSGACLSQKNAVDVGLYLQQVLKGCYYLAFLPVASPDLAKTVCLTGPLFTNIDLMMETGFSWNEMLQICSKLIIKWISNQVIACQKKKSCFCLMNLGLLFYWLLFTFPFSIHFRILLYLPSLVLAYSSGHAGECITLYSFHDNNILWNQKKLNHKKKEL